MPLIETVGRGNVGKIPGKWRKEGFSGIKYVTRPFSPFPCTFRGGASGGAGKKTTPLGIPGGETDGRELPGRRTYVYMGKRKGKGGEIFQSGGAKRPLFLLFF